MMTVEKYEQATFGAGCFWCVETVFSELRGVVQVTPGYAGGHVANPSYKQVCTGTTGHAEAVQILYDPEQISYAELLEVLFSIHDPTTLNRQGDDVGTQYRSVIFYHNPEQKRLAEEAIAYYQQFWPDPIVTAVEPFTNFYPAEDYHHNYYRLNPNQGYCRLVISPKVAKFREKFRSKLKS